LSTQEEVDINFAHDDDVLIHDKYEENMELADYTLIPKDTVFDSPEDIEETEVLRYKLTDLTSKESCTNYLQYSISDWKPFDFDRSIHNNLTHLIEF
jgi:hypothetical protein